MLVPALLGWRIQIANSQTTTGFFVRTGRVNTVVSDFLAFSF